MAKYADDGIITDVSDNSKNFNRSRFIKNVRHLLKEKTDVKLGAIEQAAGVSIGYMSRMEKSEKNTDPSIQFVVTAAKKLEISLDVLLNVDLAELNPTERYLISFIEKLISETGDDRLEWIKETAADVRGTEIDNFGVPEHPLLEMRDVNVFDSCSGYNSIKTVMVFPSHNFGADTEINGDCYHLRLKNRSMLYLMDICNNCFFDFEEKQFVKEIWMSAPGVKPKFLVANNEIKPIGELIDKLFILLKENMKHPKVQKEFRAIIDAFMENDMGDDQDTQEVLPFR